MKEHNRYDVNGIRKRKMGKNGNTAEEYTAGISTAASTALHSKSTARKPQALPLRSISYIMGHQILGAEVNGNFQFFLTDALGTVRDIVDDSGAVIQSYEFNEHGIPMPGSGAASGTFSPKTYQGALSVNDDRNDSGLYLMGHRHYAADLGRFISRDPIGFSGGLNLFNGAGTSPVTMVDPSGLRDGNTVHDNWQTSTHWNRDPADAPLRVAAPKPRRKRKFTEKIIQGTYVPAPFKWHGWHGCPILPDRSPLVDPKNLKKIDKAMTLASAHPGDLQWLSTMMSDQWNYEDRDFRMNVWGATAEAAGIDDEGLGECKGVSFFPDDKARIAEGRRFYQNATATPSMTTRTVQGSAVEPVFDFIDSINRGLGYLGGLLF